MQRSCASLCMGKTLNVYHAPSAAELIGGVGRIDVLNFGD